MKLFKLFLFTAFVLLSFSDTTAQSNQRVQLPNGWFLSPVGNSISLGDLPLNIAVAPSGKYIAVTNNGVSDHSIQLIDGITFTTIETQRIDKAWFGLVFTKDSRYLYASGGNDNRIVKYSVTATGLTQVDSFTLGEPWPVRISPTGIAIDEEKNLLYATTKENNSLYVIDLKTKRISGIYPLGGEGYNCALSPTKPELYVSCWGGGKLLVFNTMQKRFTDTIKVGSHPNDIEITANGNFLFVANANDNTISVIDLNKKRVIEILNTALYPNSLYGSTPNSLALSTDQKTLYIANADNNSLSIYDVEKPGFSSSEGFIPTGWYPTSVALVGNKILVTNGKGFSSLANPYGPNPTRKDEETIYQKVDTTKVDEQYIGSLFKGTLSIIDVPSDSQLAEYTSMVYRNIPYTKEKEIVTQGEVGNPIPTKVGDPSPIKHVFYIIKENRTYDQVLGDIPEGNGDTSLVLFGEYYTPNQHKLARDFVLLDNFYVEAEVSADGHNWSMGAYATDYLEKTWPTSYGGRGGDYDAEGLRDIADSKEYIWDLCFRHGVSFRTYGEFVNAGKPSLPILENNYCTYSMGWDESVRDTARFGIWKRDFDSLYALGKVPQLSTIHLINDHTEGLRKGRPTPFAHVADNDLAVGLLIEYLSTLPIWKETAVFILEDDAQNGPDHVDAHRSTAYVAGGFVKRKFIDHTMYSTTSMLRTIELILGMTPMSQFDAGATPMWRCFTSTADTTPFEHIPSNVDLDEVNIAQNIWQKRSEEIDLSQVDRAPDHEFSMIIWHAVKGLDVPYPAINRAAFVFPESEDEE